MMSNILTILLLFPVLAGILGAFVSKDNIRSYGVSATAFEFLLSVYALIKYDPTTPHFQFVEKFPIIPDFGINYFVGIDGFSIYLLMLSTFITFISMLALEDLRNMKNMVITLLFMEMTMIGFFIALDAIMFYIFFELSLVPMLYIIGAWGSHKRIYAAIKFFLYTFTGSVIMLLGVIYIGNAFHTATGVWSFSIIDWHMLIIPFDVQCWLFLAFFIGFAVKVPMFPFHTWLPYAHGQAPTVGSVLLAAVLLKMGTYGFLRFNLPMLPDASLYFMIPVAIIAIIMVIYTAMIAFAQEDIKQVIAYSSISHMGIIMLGIFAMNVEGIAGSVFLMISHGIVSGALFMLVGVIYERMHTKMMSEFGGIASSMPKFATIFGIMLMASVGLPLTIGFVGEFLCLVGFFRVSPWMTALAGTTIIVGAIYMLNLFRNTFFGATNDRTVKLKDLYPREIAALIPLTLLVIFLGVYPKPILKPAEKSAGMLLELMYKKSILSDSKEKLMHFNTINGGKK
jgi:NADH-quinone oxidoreductase subunit M